MKIIDEQLSNDSDVIKSSYADDPAMMKVVTEFVGGLRAEVDNMLRLLQQNDLRALQRVVHQLHGACGGYGFDAVSEPAAKAEKSIAAGMKLTSISAEINALIAVLRRIAGYDEIG